MHIILFYIKELYYKIIYIFILFIIITIFILYNIKYIILFMLEPLKKIKITQTLNNINIDLNMFTLNVYDVKFIPIIEINLPFLTTTYIYIKYIIYITIYISIPIILYLYKLNMNRILKKIELLSINYHINTLIYIFLINIITTHYIIIPLFLKFIFSHYNEFLFFEFDVELQLIKYLNFYFIILYTNFLFLLIIKLKKDFSLSKYNSILFIIIIFLPLDLTIQILYINLLIIYNICINFIYNYYLKIKKYKQMEYLEKKQI